MPRGKKGSGKQVKNVPTQYDYAEQVEEIAKDLIPKYHSHLVNTDIRYIFSNKEIKRNGKLTVGTMEKASKKVHAISNGAEFIMTISYPTFQKLTLSQQLASVDHELCHALVEDDDEGNKKLSILPHDVEEFFPVIQRHNLYLEDLKKLARVVKNTKADIQEEEEEEEEEEEDFLE